MRLSKRPGTGSEAPAMAQPHTPHPPDDSELAIYAIPLAGESQVLVFDEVKVSSK